MHAFGIGAAEDLQGHRRADHFAEARRQRLHLCPLALAGTARRFAYEHEEDGSDGKRHEEEQRRERFEDGADDEDEGNDHDKRYGRRNDGVEPRFERVDTFEGQGQDAVRVAPLGEERTMQRLAAEEACALGEAVFQMAFRQAQQRCAQEAQKQHQKI